MKNYIGTKQIKATPMTRGEYATLRGIGYYETQDHYEPGYLVEYELVGDGKPNHPDYKGYISWSPAAPFEAAYRQNGELSFGDAIIYLKQGRKVARKGWNGKDMFLWLKPQFEIKSDWCKDPQLLEICNANGGTVTGLPSISMKTADNKVVSWLASQTDILSNDWMIVE